MAGYEAFQLVVSFLQDLHLQERDGPGSVFELGSKPFSCIITSLNFQQSLGTTIKDEIADSAHGGSILYITGRQGTRVDLMARQLAGIPEPKNPRKDPKDSPGQWVSVGNGHWQMVDHQGGTIDLHRPRVKGNQTDSWRLRYAGQDRRFSFREDAETEVRWLLDRQRRGQ